MNIFEHKSYKVYTTNRIRAMPRGGRGELLKIAKELRVNSSLLSQIFRGDKDLTLEQASTVADYFGLSELEADFYLEMVQFERAGNPSLKKRVTRRMDELKTLSEQLEQRIPQSIQLDDESKAAFYSAWFFSGIRLATSIKGLHNVDAISEKLGLPKTTVAWVLRFLVNAGLCKVEQGKYQMGPARTHVPASSPLASRHRMNWRIKGIERIERPRDSDFFYTSPMVIGTNDIAKVRKILLKAIEDINKMIDPSPNEELACLNIDLFSIL